MSLARLLEYKSYFYFQHNFVFEKRLDENGIIPSFGASDNTLLKIVKTPEQFEGLLEGGFDFSACPFLRDIRSGLEKGAVIFFLFIDKKLVHTSWVSLSGDAALLDPVFQRISYQDAGHIGPCYTHVDYRGLSLYPYAITKVCEFLKSEGKGRALINTKTTNAASMRGIAKARFKKMGEVFYLKVLRWKLCLMRPNNDGC